jgi:excisionase family DNA binding protein
MLFELCDLADADDVALKADGPAVGPERDHDLAPIHRLPRRTRKKRRARRKRGLLLAPCWDGRDAFSVEEVGKILQISRMSAYTAVKTGDIPAIRIGKRVIITRGALEKLLGAGA